MLSGYFYYSSLFIYRGKSCWKGSMAAEMSSRASYFVYCIVWTVEGEFEQIIMKLCLSIKDNNN